VPLAEQEMDEENGGPDIHPFIVRIWLDETEAHTHRLFLHAIITYVLTGERQYIKNLNEIPEFIKTHLHLNGEI
jgi:hypothetical protein